MDRLVCGDVGFGKTEVGPARRLRPSPAANRVAFLAPTTLLAEQHYQTLVDRFAKWPVKVAEVSRFRSGKEITAAIKGHWRRHGGHRGGHAQAAEPESTKFQTWACSSSTRSTASACATRRQMKALRAEVDVLTLTATPIPRTLGMALEGLRDLSVIATAPQRRLAIKTFVRNEARA